MDINILKFYRIFAVIGLVLIIRQIVFLCNKPQNATYFVFPFCASAFLWGLETAVFILVDVFGKPNGLNIITSSSIAFILYLFLSFQTCSTILLYMFSGKYVEYHIVYNNFKKKKLQVIDPEESYIILYGLGLFEINKKKIYIRDIVVEQSYFVFECKSSKIFPYAAIMGTKNYMIANLISGKKVKISSNPLLLSGDIFTLSRLAKKMKIKFIDTPKQIEKNN